MNYLAGGGSRLQLNKALEQNKWYQSQNYKVGKTTRNTFDDLSQAYSKDFIGQNFNDAYDYALNRRGSVSVTGMSKKLLLKDLYGILLQEVQIDILKI